MEHARFPDVSLSFAERKNNSPQNERDNHELDNVEDAVVVSEISTEDGENGVAKPDEEEEEPNAKRRMARGHPGLDAMQPQDLKKS